jgi:hypothetical protein
MVQLRLVEETGTCFPSAQPADKASSFESAPIGTDEPTPVPQVALGSGSTLGTTHGSNVGVTGTNGAERATVPAAYSGPVIILRSTVAGGQERSAEDLGQMSGAGVRDVVVIRRGLDVLPRGRRIVTEYEPHLRRRTIEVLSELFERLRAAIGRPETAARVFSLKRFMASAYRESVVSRETRDFASAISLLQDFLSPHWSEISAGKVDEVTQTLDWLRSLPRITSKELEGLHRKLSLILGGLSVEIPDDEEGPSEISG